LLAARRSFFKPITIIAVIAAWFFANTWRGLKSYFNPDDMMNLYHAWDFPALHLFIANLTPFNRVYRPFGAFFYRALFDLFGLHPLPFRIAIFCVLLANIALLYWFAKLITESTEIAVLAALIGAYHNRVMDIYMYGGTVYDILCFFFFTAAACIYIRARRNGDGFDRRSAAAFLALNVLALNSKEMAATLPAVLLAYEWLYHRPFSFRKSWPAWSSLAITAVVAWIRTGPGVAFSGNEEYRIDVSIRSYFLTTRQFLDDLFLRRAGTVSTAKAILIFAAVVLIASLSRRRDLRLCALMILILPLPVNFIHYRGFFVMYLPLLSWSIFLAILAVAVRDGLLERIWHRPPLPVRTWEPERVALFGFVLYALFNMNAHDTARSFADVNSALGRVQMFAGSLDRLNIPLRPHSHVRLLEYDFLPDELLTPMYIVRLHYRDTSLEADVRDEGRDYHLKLTLCDQRYCVAP